MFPCITKDGVCVCVFPLARPPVQTNKRKKKEEENEIDVTSILHRSTQKVIQRQIYSNLHNRHGGSAG